VIRLKRKKEKSLGKFVTLLFFITMALFIVGVFFLIIDFARIAAVFFGVGFIVFVVFLRFFWKFLLSKKYFRAGLGFIKNILRYIPKFASKIMPQNILRLTVFRDEKISLFRTSNKKRTSPYRRMKWKELKNDTERVRFVYYFFMRKKIKKGYQYQPSHTPSEILFNIRQNNDIFNETKLFEMYNAYRYNDTEKITEKTECLKTFI